MRAESPADADVVTRKLVAAAALRPLDPRGGACTAPGCACQGFWGQPYYEDLRSDLLLIFTLKGLLPAKYRESMEIRDSRLKIDWKRLAAQPGGQQLIARIAQGEDFRIVLAGILDQLRESGIVEEGEPRRLGQRRRLPPGRAEPTP